MSAREGRRRPESWGTDVGNGGRGSWSPREQQRGRTGGPSSSSGGAGPGGSARSSNSSSAVASTPPPDTVGSLLAGIATAVTDALTAMRFADKRQWGPDEFEQVRALERALDEAKRDFQQLSALVNGQSYYTGDVRHESLDELRALRAQFDAHTQTFKDWVRTGGPINPLWSRDTASLAHELHRAQRRAAGRIFHGDQETEGRCLGAFQVHRMRRMAAELLEGRRQPEGHGTGGGGVGSGAGARGARVATWQRTNSLPQQQQQRERRYGDVVAENEAAAAGGGGGGGVGEREWDGPSPEEEEEAQRLELQACAEVGHFERLGDRDIGFVCDFCDGFIIWEDLRRVPTVRALPGLDAHRRASSSSNAAGAGFGHTRNRHSGSNPNTGIISASYSYFATGKGPSTAAILPTAAVVHTPPIPLATAASATVPVVTGGPQNQNQTQNQQRQQQRTSLPPRDSTASWTSSNATPPPTPPPAAPPLAIGTAHEYWQCAGRSVGGGGDEGEGEGSEKTVVFAPLAVASHLPPEPGDWQARLLCHYCDTVVYEGQGDGEVERTRYAQDEKGFASLRDLQTHLELYHTSLVSTIAEGSRTATCAVM